MDVNIIDEIPEDKPHCMNCSHWGNRGELFALCDVTNENCPSFAVCDQWQEVS